MAIAGAVTGAGTGAVSSGGGTGEAGGSGVRGALELGGRLDRVADDLARKRSPAAEQDWAHGLAALLKDKEALDKALANPARLPRVPPGMPIGMDESL